MDDQLQTLKRSALLGDKAARIAYAAANCRVYGHVWQSHVCQESPYQATFGWGAIYPLNFCCYRCGMFESNPANLPLGFLELNFNKLPVITIQDRRSQLRHYVSQANGSNIINGTFRAYHGYENSGCGGKALKADTQREAIPLSPSSFI